MWKSRDFGNAPVGNFSSLEIKHFQVSELCNLPCTFIRNQRLPKLEILQIGQFAEVQYSSVCDGRPIERQGLQPLEMFKMS
jgi:hypothetical protein